MRKRLSVWILSATFSVAVLAVPVVMPLTGCASTGNAVDDNAVHYVRAEQVYAAALRTYTRLSATGKTTLAQDERFERAANGVDIALNSWKDAVAAGQPGDWQSSFDTALDVVESIIGEIK